MNAFEPIYFGDDTYGYNRFVAICKENYIFVGDAKTYDYDNKERATVVWFGKIEDVNSIEELVNKFGQEKWSFISKPNLWMLDADKIELIMLHNVYAGKAYAHVIN